MKGLYIPKELLITASGLDRKTVDADIKKGKLIVDEKNEIWYHNALKYISEKWSEGESLMYPPLNGNDNSNFPARLLSLIDDQLSVGNLELTWKHQYND